jgi:hypothetical protein
MPKADKCNADAIIIRQPTIRNCATIRAAHMAIREMKDLYLLVP